MTILQNPQTQTQTAQIFEYVLVLWTGELEETDDGYPVPKEIETVYPVFDHEPSESDWQNWLAGWFSAGWQKLSRPCRINSQDYEF